MPDPHDAHSTPQGPEAEPDTTKPAPLDQDPTLVADRYRIQRTLGRGGGGHVWLATDEKLGREVALKRVAGEADTGVLLSRGMREARTSATLANEHVVRVYDAFEHEGSPWIVMEYIKGQSLAELIEDGTRVSVRRAAEIGAQMATALAAAHRAGILHRDVKPANILLSQDHDGDDAKLTDFGIARAEEDPQLTRTGFVSGTAAYFSPELARGENPSAASDVWALGASLYAAVEGERPFPARSNAVAQLHTIVNEQVRPPQRAEELTPVLAGMLDPDPEARWDAARAAAALRTISTGGTITGTAAAGAAAASAEHTQAVPAPEATRTFARQNPTPAAHGSGQRSAVPPPAAPQRQSSAGPPRQQRPPRRRGMLLGWLVAVPLLALLVWLVWSIASGLDGNGGGSSTSQDPATPVSSREATTLAEDFYSTLDSDGIGPARELMTADAWLPGDIADGLASIEVTDLQATEQDDGNAQVIGVVTYTYGSSTIVQDETLGISRATGELLIFSRAAVAQDGGGDEAPAPDEGETDEGGTDEGGTDEGGTDSEQSTP